MSKQPNKLINEKSPYLLQHAYNPVNWYPWGEEAFKKALTENKPIFLSIGYSTCHWCHVMEKESFEDNEVAKAMNDSFISIKVDREERPDIDSIYMLVCQIMTGSGGWPLNVVLDTNKKPFFAGTYFPKQSKYGRIGMLDLIPRLNDVWANKKEELEKSSEYIVDIINNSSKRTSEEKLSREIIDKAFNNLLNNFDSTDGGFGSAPKFPSPQNFIFLLRHFTRTKNPKALEMVEKTLTKMSLGGIFDHIGFGFHRYSTDKNWLVPHFEKMLYDQAMLITAYAEAYEITRNEAYKSVIDKTITYILRDMTSLDGGFYSAEDADSEGVEGKFYVWTENELKEVLKEDFAYAKNIFNTEDNGNFLEESTRQKTDENILHLRTNNLNVDHFNKIREKLFTEREKREHPYKDNKILTDWNGLMIAALAKAGRALKNTSYIAAAEKSFDFIQKNLMNDDGKLIHRFREGESSIQAILDDYAFLTHGLFELYNATFGEKYILEAKRLVDLTLKHFWDKELGGFFLTPDDGEVLIVRKKDFYDGAIPSGNSIMLSNLFKIYKITHDEQYIEYIQRLIDAFTPDVINAPHGFTQFLANYDSVVNTTNEIIISSKSSRNMKDALTNQYLPFSTIIVLNGEHKDLIELAPYLNNYTDNKIETAYICSNFTCKKPISELDEFKKEIETLGI